MTFNSYDEWYEWYSDWKLRLAIMHRMGREEQEFMLAVYGTEALAADAIGS